ncbi:MAG: cytochrome c biogenesis protein CcdA [Planctomycetota bacterium]|nr:cytochrome c biogenesis protein CcdA [Planctomycetota bacterium]
MWFGLLILVAFVHGAAAVDEQIFRQHGVQVALRYEIDTDGLVLVAVFTPERPELHLYAKDLPDGLPGVPTRLELAAEAPVTARGPLRDDQPVFAKFGSLVYPDGAAVTLRLPISSPRGTGMVPIPVLISYMACTAEACLVPVIHAPMQVAVPTAGPVGVQDPPTTLDAIQRMLRFELADAERRWRAAWREDLAMVHDPAAIRWQRPRTVAEVERLIAAAHAEGRAALLDFTGPSCVNCQYMAKTVFRLPAVAKAWNQGLPIEIDTDPPHSELAAWQQQRFATQTRPLYVRIAPDGTETRWERVFSPTDRELVARFIAFLEGREQGLAEGLGDSWQQFLWLAVLGGLFTLVMPCTYPMIPFTVNWFAKQAALGKRMLPLAVAYGLGIVACFVGVGLAVVGLFGASLAGFAGHPVTNLLVAILFLIFGLSLLGAIFLQPPQWLLALAGGGRAGYAGALLMGLTFAVTAFTCTAPFAGAVLAAGVAQGAWLTVVIGMTVYSSAIAIPFVALALAPGWLSRLPRAGSWMHEIKVIGGLIEIAAAFKFLAICDYAWGWNVVGRTLTLALWASTAAAIASYVLGWWRTPDDEPIERVGPGRLLLALAFGALALWLAAGACGERLGLVESFFPADQ